MAVGRVVLPWALLALVCLSLSVARDGPADLQVGDVSKSQRQAGGLAGSAFLKGVTDPVEIELCECEKAVGSPDGLSCQKEGWFVSSFERQGSWLSGGGLVPLSHSVCCRPCLPATLPEDPSGTVSPDDKAVALVSIGCHASTGSGVAALQCEMQGGSFVTGFGKAIHVSPTIDASYPVGSAECCTPSVLLSSGDAWELERCGCELSSDINCGGATTHKLLMGFFNFRVAGDGEYVPIAPANCCKVCLSQRVHRMDTCFDLSFCHGHGVCILGQCECIDGWVGPDCSARAGSGDGDFPGWAIALIVIGGVIILAMILAGAAKIIRYYQDLHADGGESEEGEQLREPLLLRFADDDDGSVGSEDTTDCESEEEEDAERLGGADGDATEDEDAAAETGAVAARGVVGAVPPGEAVAEVVEPEATPSSPDSAGDGAFAPEGMRLTRLRPRTPPLQQAPPRSPTATSSDNVASDTAAQEPAEVATAADGAAEQEAAGGSSPSAAAPAPEQVQGQRQPQTPPVDGDEPEPVASIWQRRRRRHRAGGSSRSSAVQPAEGSHSADAPATPAGQLSYDQVASTPYMSGQGTAARSESDGAAGAAVSGSSPAAVPVSDSPAGSSNSAGSTGSQGSGEIEAQGEAGGDVAGSSRPLNDHEDGYEDEDPLANVSVDGGDDGCGAGAGIGPLAAVDCSVCLVRPIQVVVIPCGHACMCRRCSRRLSRCPICRKEIARRQRLFVGG